MAIKMDRVLCCLKANEVDDNSRGKKPRGCTNTVCLSLFIIYWGAVIFVAAFSFVIGDPKRLIYGEDSFGNTCGRENEALGNLTFSGMDMSDRPYLFFLNMTNIRESLKICVKQCPHRMLKDEIDMIDFERETGSKLCRYDFSSVADKSYLYPAIGNATVEASFHNTEEKLGHRPCPVAPVYGTKALFNRCIPIPVISIAKDVVYNIYAYLNSFDTLPQIVSDIYAGRYEILGMIGLAFILSLIVNFTIHWLASFVAWIIMVLVSVVAILVTGLLWWTYADIKWQLDTTPFNQLLIESAKNEHTFLVYAIISTVLTVVLLLIVLVMRRRVQFVVKLFEEAGICIRSMPCLLLQPIFTFLVMVLFFIFWIALLFCLATAYYPEKNKVNSPVKLALPLQSLDNIPVNETMNKEEIVTGAVTLVSYSQRSWVQCTWLHHLFAFIWTTECILGCQQMVIAGAVASWYFSRDRQNERCLIGKSMKRLLMYHLGTVTLASFLILLFKIPRIFFTYIEAKMRKHENITVVRYCIKCCTCCFACLECCMKYINHNAYAITAIQGVGYCKAAYEAVVILGSNAAQVATINSVGDFILFLGKCTVTAITTFVGILIMKNNPELHFYAVPVFLVSVFSFFIAHCVLSVYEMVIDTLFLCCCEDLLRNDGSKDKPYYGGSLVRYLRGDEGDGEAMQPLESSPSPVTKDDLPEADV